MQLKIIRLLNRVIRFFTRNNYYICKHCHKLQKNYPLSIPGCDYVDYLTWGCAQYSNVCRECVYKQQMELAQVIRNKLVVEKGD